MPLVFLSSFGGVAAQFFDNNGVPLAGGKIFSFDAGTTTPAVLYTDSSGTFAQSNPIILNSAGRVPSGEIWQPSGTTYKFVLTTTDDVLIGTYDNIGTIAAGSAFISNFNGNGVAVNFSLPFAPIDENATNVYINGIYQQKNTYSLAANVLVFSQAPPLTSTIEIMYF